MASRCKNYTLNIQVHSYIAGTKWITTLSHLHCPLLLQMVTCCLAEQLSHASRQLKIAGKASGWWVVTLSSSPFWQARALPSLTTSATAEGCQAPKLSTATNLLKSALIKVPQKSHLSEERAGAQSLFGKWPNRPRISFNSTSLRHIVVNCCESYLRTCCCQIHQ